MKLFQRLTENFICDNCRHRVTGTGYTNHCSKCLYSKHVDVNPGDRDAICQGLMKPVGFEQKHGEYIILHKCEKCGFTRKNKLNPTDDFDKLIALN